MCSGAGAVSPLSNSTRNTSTRCRHSLRPALVIEPPSQQMQGSQLEDGDSAHRPIGKKELLLWASEVTGMICCKFEDLRDGVIIMKLISSIWPRAVDPRNSRKMKAAPQLDWELKRNWDTIKDIMTDIRLPVQLVDRAAIQQGRFRACYNLLVMLFFMMSLTKHREFSVDFAHPIDPRLSSFLQSNASIDALSRGGALSVQPSDTDEGDDSVPDSARHSSSNTAAQLSADSASGHTSSPSPSMPLRSHLGLYSEPRASQSSSADQPYSSSSQSSTNATTPSSGPGYPPTSSTSPPLQSSAALQHARGIASMRLAPPPLRSSVPSLSNAIAFNSLEQKFIDVVNDLSALDVEWHDAAGPSAGAGMSLAATGSWLQQTFPALRDVEATRLAFERASQKRDSFCNPHSNSETILMRDDFAEFLVRALYYHRFAPFHYSASHTLIPHSNVQGLCCLRRCVYLRPPTQQLRNNRKRLYPRRSVEKHARLLLSRPHSCVSAHVFQRPV